MDRYQDRIDAGRTLGRLLGPRIDGPAVVLAVPRAGVQVGAQVAEALHVPLLPLLVRKVGLPEQRDVVVGAIDADGAFVKSPGIKDTGLLPGEVESMGEDVAMRLLRWREIFGAPDPATVVRGKVAVIVDDAIVSGVTTQAAIAFLRRRGAERIVVAVPCGVRSSVAALEAPDVEVVVPILVDRPEEINAVYEHLAEVSAEEVVHLLARGGPSRPPGFAVDPIGERSVRLVDLAAVSHKATLRLPSGLGPNPGVILVGAGMEPGNTAGESMAVRLADAGIASVRLEIAGGASNVAVLELALDVLSARPELDAWRLGILASREACGAAVEVAEHDRRVTALALLAPPAELEAPDRSLVAAGEAFEPRSVDRVARWLADRLRPGVA